MLIFAIIITCYNRKEQTLSCIRALYKCERNDKINFEVFLLDDASSDGTPEAITENYPQIHLLKGTGSLFWAGGMRIAWREALKAGFENFLLLNDDTLLCTEALNELVSTDDFSIKSFSKQGIYIGSTRHPITQKHTYGGIRVGNFKFPSTLKIVYPNGEYPQPCHLGNANIMYIPKEVVTTLGIFSDNFTHSIADYDYTMRAIKNEIPVLICSNYCGTCIDDHEKNWLGPEYSLKQRIGYLKSIKGLAYKEYLYFICSHFPLYYPVAFVKLWLKAIFPFIWEKFKSE